MEIHGGVPLSPAKPHSPSAERPTLHCRGSLADLQVTALDETSAMVCWTRTYESAGWGRCAVLTRNGTTLVKGDEYEFSAEKPESLSIASFDAAAAILCYSDGCNENSDDNVNCPSIARFSHSDFSSTYNRPYKCCALGVSGMSISQDSMETPLSSEQHGTEGGVAVLDAHTALACYRSQPCARIPRSASRLRAHSLVRHSSAASARDWQGQDCLSRLLSRQSGLRVRDLLRVRVVVQRAESYGHVAHDRRRRARAHRIEIRVPAGPGGRRLDPCRAVRHELYLD